MHNHRNPTRYCTGWLSDCREQILQIALTPRGSKKEENIQKQISTTQAERTTYVPSCMHACMCMCMCTMFQARTLSFEGFPPKELLRALNLPPYQPFETTAATGPSTPLAKPSQTYMTETIYTYQATTVFCTACMYTTEIHTIIDPVALLKNTSALRGQ
jgi:hypothetical protein